MSEEVIKGYVEHIVYRNEKNGYTVFHLSQEKGELTCVGKFLFIDEGEVLELTGTYGVHRTYGTQFCVSSYRACRPEDVTAIERYLGSGAIRGVGAALAKRIVKAFQEDTFRIIEEEPERLAEIKGISERKAREIAVQVEEKRDMRQAMLFLQKYGISMTMAAKIYQRYGQSVYHVIEENPYRLADQIDGIGFKTADEIALRTGVSADSEFRIRSGILYMLTQYVGAGHIFADEQSLLYRAEQLLGVGIADGSTYLMDLAMEKRVVLKRAKRPDTGETYARVYPSRFYYMEMETAQMLHDLSVRQEIADDLFTRRLSQIEEEIGMELDAMQREAVREAVQNGVTIVTGGPGTGKTTTINAMIRFFESEGADLYLAAPTGRAAKRMTETTGVQAQTIHRLLEVNGNPEERTTAVFGRNEEHPLEADAIIIDEMSMVDLPLMYALLHAIVPGTRLILVGDENQLPSVGPGSVLKDLIRSQRFPVVKLTRIFRQAGESDIVLNAHKINRGEPVVTDNKSRDFFFLKRQDPAVIIRVMLTLIAKKLPAYVGVDSFDIQVLTPMRRGNLGVEQLNKELQKYLNPPARDKQEKEHGGRIFREGDKVMQIKNDYQLEWEITTENGLVVDAGQGIFNGDMGVIRQINPYEETVTVEYDEHRQVHYSYMQLEELEHAYAITVHKAQGSEYPAVIIPLLMGPRQLYNRNLLYTAVTRAKQCVILVGNESDFQEMIKNNREQARNTSLDEQIRACWL